MDDSTPTVIPKECVYGCIQLRLRAFSLCWGLGWGLHGIQGDLSGAPCELKTDGKLVCRLLFSATAIRGHHEIGDELAEQVFQLVLERVVDGIQLQIIRILGHALRLRLVQDTKYHAPRVRCNLRLNVARAKPAGRANACALGPMVASAAPRGRSPCGRSTAASPWHNLAAANGARCWAGRVPLPPIASAPANALRPARV